VSIQDERDLRAQLSGLLDGVTVRPAPVAATVRQGRRIRLERRISAAAGVAVVVAAAAALPVVLTGRPHSAGAVTSAHYSVRVNVLDPIARGGVIAEGVTDGKKWKVEASGAPGNVTVHAVGVTGANLVNTQGPLATPNPIVMQTIGDAFDEQGAFTTFYGLVSQNVARVAVQLPDGEHPSLTPVSWGGYRWVGLVLPARVPIVRAVVYSGLSVAYAELAYAVPFRGSAFIRWWHPGQVGPAPVTRSLGSGVANGKPWRATASIGPWGWCFVYGLAHNEAEGCSGVAPAVEFRGQEVAVMQCTPATGDTPAMGVAFAASDVTRVVLRFSDGTSASFRPVEVAGSRVFGYAIPMHARVTGSREYGARGPIISLLPSAPTVSPRWGC